MTNSYAFSSLENGNGKTTAANSDQENDEVTSDDESDSESNMVIEDKSIPPSKLTCSGCGAAFQCQNQFGPGFLSAEKFKILTKDYILQYSYCLNCENIRHTETLMHSFKTSASDYETQILNRIIMRGKCLVILLVDLVNMPNSIYNGWSKLIARPKNIEMKAEIESDDESDGEFDAATGNSSTIEIFILGNKVDLLPNTSDDFLNSVKKCLIENCKAKGIDGEQIKYVQLISAKSLYNIEELISELFHRWNDRGYISILFSRLPKSNIFN